MSKFTQQHYEVVAQTLCNTLPPLHEVEAARQHFAMCKALAKAFESDNRNFLKDVFYRKCGWISYVE